MRISDWSSDVCSSDLTVTKEADRMGLRLDGPVIEHTSGADIASEGLVTGCIQIPGNGRPIILMADRQTTGGYTKIANVISADQIGRASSRERVCQYV